MEQEGSVSVTLWDREWPSPEQAAEQVCRRRMGRAPTLKALDFSSGLSSGKKPWLTFATDS